MGRIDFFPYDLDACLTVAEIHKHTCVVYCSYGQLSVSDYGKDDWPGNWTQAHLDQGFIRHPHSLGIATLINYGNCFVSIQMVSKDFWPNWLGGFTRMVALPLTVSSGKLLLQSPDDPIDRTCEVEPGSYLVVVAQRIKVVGDEECLEMAICLEKTESLPRQSQILIADPDLHPPTPLEERGDLCPMD